MTADEIEDLIRKEIGDLWNISNAHGVDLKKCLVKPEKHTFTDSLTQHTQLELWLVLEELPDTRGGYQIVFDERTQMFGLATTDVKTGRIYLGPYGSFLETLEGM